MDRIDRTAGRIIRRLDAMVEAGILEQWQRDDLVRLVGNLENDARILGFDEGWETRARFEAAGLTGEQVTA